MQRSMEPLQAFWWSRYACAQFGCSCQSKSCSRRLSHRGDRWYLNAASTACSRSSLRPMMRIWWSSTSTRSTMARR